MTNAVANRLIIPVLKSRAGEQLGHRLAVVEYLGRRTGQHRQLVTQYVLAGRDVRINVGMAERKSWWRNFEEPRPMQLRLAGVTYQVSACAVRQGNQVNLTAQLNGRGEP